MLAWLVNEWGSSSTHIWLASAGASITAYANGSMTLNQLIAALVVSAIGIIVPQAPPAPKP